MYIPKQDIFKKGVCIFPNKTYLRRGGGYVYPQAKLIYEGEYVVEH
jgi:hypothetical protein